MGKTRILIIDDEKENVQYLTTVLKENGFNEIYAAFDGVEGISKVKGLNPGLILLDLRMPKKNGLAVFNELKKSPDLKDIPVIILTGEGGFLKHLAELRAFHENSDHEGTEPTEIVLNRFITARPDAFLEKPINPEALLDALRKILVTPDDMKLVRWDEIKALREKKLAGGIFLKDIHFASDEKSRNNLTALAVRLLSADLPSSAGFLWRSTDNQNVSFSRNDIMEFHSAITDWVYNTYLAAWEHKKNVGALTTVEEIKDYDIQAGWPSNIL